MLPHIDMIQMQPKEVRFDLCCPKLTDLSNLSPPKVQIILALPYFILFQTLSNLPYSALRM